jgi:hypothetical protein
MYCRSLFRTQFIGETFQTAVCFGSNSHAGGQVAARGAYAVAEGSGDAVSSASIRITHGSGALRIQTGARKLSKKRPPTFVICSAAAGGQP